MNTEIQCLLLLSIFLSALVCSCDEYYLHDEFGLGRSFDGIGGLSGGGVSVLLLVWFSFSESLKCLVGLYKMLTCAEFNLFYTNAFTGNIAFTSQLCGTVSESSTGLPFQGVYD